MGRRAPFFATLAFLVSVPCIAAAEAAGAPPIPLPIFDSDNFGHAPPSMAQSLALTTLFYEESHAALQRAWGTNERWGKATVALFDAITSGIIPLPLSDTWLHEEFHRAVMSNRGAGSFNDVYRFKLVPQVIAVSHVRDDDLARLKRDHPADFVRLHAAGVEGEHALVQRLEGERFFRRSRAYNLPIYWLVKVNSAFYILSGTSDAAERGTTREEREEGTNVRRRDFTGHDFTAWVYDLFRPDEPYAARGIHPSGTGVRRYRRPSDLTREEHDYLEMVGRRALLNFLDPNLIGIDSFRTGRTRWSATASSLLTSFGTTTDLNAFVERGPRQLAVTLHRYANRDRAFPGIDAELPGARLSPRISVWMQPRDQRFRTHDAQAGGLAAVTLRHKRFAFELEAKSAGWVEGNVHLERAVSARVGVLLRRP